MEEKIKEIEEKENELRVKEEELKLEERKKRNWEKRKRVKKERGNIKTKDKWNKKDHNGSQTGGCPAPTYGLNSLTVWPTTYFQKWMNNLRLSSKD